MPDLRNLLDDAVAARVVPASGVEAITRRAEAIRARQARRRLGLLAMATTALAVAGSLAWAGSDGEGGTRVAARTRATSTTSPSPAQATPGGPARPAEVDDPPPGSPRTNSEAAPPTWPPPPGLPPGIECKAGRNGGPTDIGVTARRIDVAMLATIDGPLRGLTEGAAMAMKTVVDDVNRSGGICGRLIDFRVVDDPDGPAHWPPDDGLFAAFVGPLHPELDARIADGSVDREGMPVVGTDGSTTGQFRSRWVWPVGTPIPSMVRIAVDHAYRTLGARSFALVHERVTDPSGATESTLREYVATLPGATVRSVHELDPDKPSYNSEQNEFGQRCGSESCDVVLLSLLPETRDKWLRNRPTRGRLQDAELRLFSDRGDPGPGRHVWVGYTPPASTFLHDPDVAEYQEDVGRWNPFTEGAYVGALVFVEALKRTGPQLTRARLREVLDSMHFESGLVGGLSWSPKQRVGNPWARLLRIGETVEDITGWVRDPATRARETE